MTLEHHVDANLFHDLITGRSATGIPHLCNHIPVDWSSKKQPGVETKTYGSEFTTARTYVEQVMNLCLTLCYLVGVPLRTKSYMFRDNKIAVDYMKFVYSARVFRTPYSRRGDTDGRSQLKRLQSLTR